MKNSPHPRCKQSFYRTLRAYRPAILLVLLCALSLTACKSPTTEQQGAASAEKSAPPADKTDPAKSAPMVSGVCANDYYPVSATLKREYRVSYEGNALAPATYSESLLDITADSFKVKTTFEGGTGVTHGWKCSGDGLAALEYANVNFANQNQSNMQLDVKTISAKGVFIPSEGNWKVGYKWSNEYDVAGTMKGTGAMPSGDMKSNVTLEHEIIGEESVTVAAGTFNTFKVKSKITQKGIMQMTTGPVTSVPLNVSFDLIMYQAKGVGLVKSVIEKAATTELLSFTK
jgi:hypothetical protein